jgi:hypothetical protein
MIKPTTDERASSIPKKEAAFNRRNRVSSINPWTVPRT